MTFPHMIPNTFSAHPVDRQFRILLLRLSSHIRARTGISHPMARSLFESLAAFLHARLTPKSHLRLHLTIGALVMVGASILFGMLAEVVMTADEITVVDVQVANWFHGHAMSPVTQFMLLVTDRGNNAVLRRFGRVSNLQSENVAQRFLSACLPSSWWPWWD